LLARGADVARAERHHPVMEPELLQRRLRVAHQLLERVQRDLGPLEPDELDLVELVLPDDALRVLAVAAGLAAEAWGEGAVLPRKVFEDLVAVVVRDRHLRRRDEIVAGRGLAE